MYKIRVSGEQGNPDWERTARTLRGAQRIAKQHLCMGIDYAIYDNDDIPVYTYEAWQSGNRWGHTGSEKI